MHDFFLRMRYGTDRDIDVAKTYCSFESIAKALAINYTTARDVALVVAMNEDTKKALANVNL